MAASVSIEMFARGAFMTVTLPGAKRSCFRTSRSVRDQPGLRLAHRREPQMLDKIEGGGIRRYAG